MSASEQIDAVLAAVDAGFDESLERLFAFARIPSISTDPAYDQDCRQAADWLSAEIESLGFAAQQLDTPEVPTGKPMVVGRARGAASAHVLFYGHYDVQPVDPLDLWTTPPFEPKLETRADGTQQLLGRGMADDKGQLMTFVEACRAWRAVTGALPVTTTLLFEGEEESGSPSMAPFLARHGHSLKADIALVCDTAMWDAETPAITTSLRGMARDEVVIRGADRDLHSGFYGGAARNPIEVLAKILGDLRDADGRIQLDGFYDGVPEIPEHIAAIWDRLDFDPAAFLGDVGLSAPAGEAGRSVLEQVWSRPTAEINGIAGGYAGEGFKTVLPAEARAKVSFRLVAGQDPEKIRAAFRRFVTERLPSDCQAEFISHSGGAGIALPVDSPMLRAAADALSAEWPKPAALIGCGGSIPIVGAFKRVLDMDALLVGFGLPDDNLHSPNEKYNLTSFRGGIRSWVRILAALADR